MMDEGECKKTEAAFVRLIASLTVVCGVGIFDRTGRSRRFASKNGGGCGRERVNDVLRDWGDPISDAVSGQSLVSTQVGALAVDSRPEWRVSVRRWISDDGIMRCRS